MYCESCGKKIDAHHEPRKKDSRSASAKRQSQSFVKAHAPALIISLLFLGWAVYDEADRDFPASDEHVHTAGGDEHASQEREIDQLQQRVEANPEDDTALLRLANLLQDHSSHDQRYLVRAIETYQKYLSRNPDEENARVDLGICYFSLAGVDSIHGATMVQRALKEIGTVAQANPNHQAAAFNLGIVNLNIGSTEEAAAWFRKAIAIDPSTDLGMRSKRLLEQHVLAAPSM
jgi:tetratricopeptide (TPR) repeat protein